MHRPVTSGQVRRPIHPGHSTHAYLASLGSLYARYLCKHLWLLCFTAEMPPEASRPATSGPYPALVIRIKDRHAPAAYSALDTVPCTGARYQSAPCWIRSDAMRCDSMRCCDAIRSKTGLPLPSVLQVLGCPFARTNCFPLQIATAPHWLRLARRTNEVDDILRPDFVYGASACISLQRASQFGRTLPTDLTASHRLPVQNQLGTFAWASAHAALHTLMGRLPNRHRRLRVSDSIIRGRIPEV